MRNCTIVLALFAAFVLALGTWAQAATIYSDDFSGNGANLNGTAPDTRPGTETWASTTNNYFLDNGTVGWFDGSLPNPGASGINGTSAAWLPFTPVAGKIYQVSADMTARASGHHTNLSLGFAEFDAKTGYFQNTVNGYGHTRLYINLWTNPTGDGRTAPGVRDSGWSSFGSINRDQTYAIKTVFDAQDANPANWTMEWFVDGSQVRVPTTASSGSYADIHYVGFTAAENRTHGTIDNLLLEDVTPADTVIPEPSTLVIWALGLLGLLLVGRRRKR